MKYTNTCEYGICDGDLRHREIERVSSTFYAKDMISFLCSLFCNSEIRKKKIEKQKFNKILRHRHADIWWVGGFATATSTALHSRMSMYSIQPTDLSSAFTHLAICAEFRMISA